jgi:hypothetical protein
MSRRIVTLTATADYTGRHTVWAVCDDGTFWQFDPHHAEATNAWIQLPTPDGALQFTAAHVQAIRELAGDHQQEYLGTSDADRSATVTALAFEAAELIEKVIA